MSQIPFGVFLPLLACGAFLVWSKFVRKASVAKWDATYSQYRAGELANLLGLQLVEGDPNFNLFITDANAAMARTPTDGSPVSVRVRMQGARNGTPLELIYAFRKERHTGFGDITWKTWFDCRLIATARQAFPEFEVTSRRAQPTPVAATRPLPPLPTGDPLVDAAYAVATAEPRLAQHLGPHLGGFDVLGEAGVHLVGDGRTVAFIMQKDKAPLVPSVLFHADHVAGELVRVARALGG
jgi:hypothetical protein